MIRKVSHIAFATLLVILTTGFSVSKHYCRGTLVKVSLFAEQSAGCRNNKKACSRKNCCHNEHQFFQLHETYTTPAIRDTVQFFPVTLAIIDLNLLMPESDQFISLNYFSKAESPPPPDIMTILTSLQIFRL